MVEKISTFETSTQVAVRQQVLVDEIVRGGGSTSMIGPALQENGRTISNRCAQSRVVIVNKN